MDHLVYIKSYLEQSIQVKQSIAASVDLQNRIDTVASICVNALKQKKRIFFAGNGGSAADAQHLAAEFVSRFNYDRPGLAGMALTTDTSILTAIGNDYGYDQLFSRQIEALAQPGDILIGLTTSGNSKNILKAIDAAKSMGVYTIGFCGESGKILEQADFCLSVPSTVTPFIQESHITIGHIICAIVEFSIFPQSEKK